MAQRPTTPVDADNLRERFALLLSGFSTFTARSQSDCGPQTAGIRDPSERLKEVPQRADAAEGMQTAEDHRRLYHLLAKYRDAEELDRQYQTQFADDFNLLEVLQLTRNELRHSMVLAWLLDDDLRALGTHAQGILGFRLFLEEFGLPSRYAETKYRVRREVHGEESTVDVEVACRREFLIHIENKIGYAEGPDQTNREWADVQRRRTGLELSSEQVHALYLTPHGMKPANANFRPVSWGRIAVVFTRFADQAQPEDVKLFARHYARTLRRFIAIQERNEDNDGQTPNERG